MYKKLPSLEEARIALAKINECLGGGNYTDPIPHPTKNDVLLKFVPEDLSECQDILVKYPTLTADQVGVEGWYIGYFSGRFGKSRAKLEEAQLLYEALADPPVKDNRPVFRALFFAYLSTLYSLQESIQKVCEGRKGTLEEWWQLRSKELKAKNELLFCFNKIGNRDKHNHENFFRYPAKVYGINISTNLPPGWPSGQYRVIMSGEGNFALFDEGKKTFRRIPLGLGQGQYTIELIGAPARHLGQPIVEYDVVALCRLAREYFEDILFQAEAIEKEDASV